MTVLLECIILFMKQGRILKYFYAPMCDAFRYLIAMLCTIITSVDSFLTCIYLISFGRTADQWGLHYR